MVECLWAFRYVGFFSTAMVRTNGLFTELSQRCSCLLGNVRRWHLPTEQSHAKARSAEDHEVVAMTELGQKDRLPGLGETVIDVVAATCDDESLRGPTVSSGSVEIVATVAQDGADLPSTELVLLVRAVGTASALSRSVISVHHRTGR